MQGKQAAQNSTAEQYRIVELHLRDDALVL
jgi:hypothetical protein